MGENEAELDLLHNILNWLLRGKEVQIYIER
jgi:hypothetical protein